MRSHNSVPIKTSILYSTHILSLFIEFYKCSSEEFFLKFPSILVPGGTLSQEGEGPYKTDACIFNTPDEINLEIMKSWEQVFVKLMRRYKYLEKLFQVSCCPLFPFCFWFFGCFHLDKWIADFISRIANLICNLIRRMIESVRLLQKISCRWRFAVNVVFLDLCFEIVSYAIYFSFLWK